MVAWISNWVGGIAVAIVLATILEMIIPNGHSKKYVKTIIGLFILFTIIGPVISKFSNIDLSSFNTSIEVSGKTQGVDIQNTSNQELEKLYRSNLEKDIKEKLYTKGYDVTITALSVTLIEGDNYGRINKLTVKVNESNIENKRKEENVNSISVEGVKEVKIDVNNSVTEVSEDSVKNEIKQDIINYLSDEYEINKENINVI